MLLVRRNDGSLWYQGDQKAARALEIQRAMEDAGYRRAVCFTCGNAAAALRARGVQVLSVGRGQDLEPRSWWTPTQVAAWFPGCFDATSGHLSVEMMARIGVPLASGLRAACEGLQVAPHEWVNVPTGSGETYVCLRLGLARLWNPEVVRLRAVWDVSEPATSYDSRAPLVSLVKALCPEYLVTEGETCKP